MTIARVILFNVPNGRQEEAQRVWLAECGPLIKRQKGCRLEKLMKSLDRPELFISYSEWDSLADIERYRASEEHDAVQRETRAIQGARAVVWAYEIVE